MKILVLNGANLNMLHRRSSIYGNISILNLQEQLQQYVLDKRCELIFEHSNSEGGIIDILQNYIDTVDGVILNAGAYTHYSYSIRDCVEYMPMRVVEVHLTNIDSREKWRQQDVLYDVVDKRIMGEGIVGYCKAIDYLIDNYEN